MVWQLQANFLQDRRGFELIGVAGIGRVGAFIEGQAIKNRCFGIVGVTRGELFHGFLVETATGLLVQFVGIFEKRLGSIEPILFALRLRMQRFPLLDCIVASFQGIRSKRPDQRVRALTQGQSPICHRTNRVDRRNLVEGFDRLRIKKRMQHADGDIELGLCSGIAGDWKMNGPECLPLRS